MHLPETPCVAAIHDLSGYGRCSLTVAIPVLSAMGIQCCPLPTAFLSTHTGGFTGYSFLDMTEEMEKAAAHWKTLELHFHAIYTGFLGSERQIGTVSRFLKDFRAEDTLVILDPVMGDHGQAYATYTEAMCRGMAELAESADVITPNLTEAAFLLDEPYSALPGDRAGLEELVKRLSLDGRRSVVLTGVSLQPGKVGAMSYDRDSGTLRTCQTDYIAHDFHGTGDVYSSVLTGALVQGKPLFDAAEQAADFVRECAKRTVAKELTLREGVDFEPLLPLLMRRDA